MLERAAKLPAKDALADKLRAVAGKLDEVKKKIVATTEGGAITGEERIREHLDTLYGAINGYEGRPTKYQVERIAVLRRELTEVGKELVGMIAKDARALDDELKQHKLEPIPAAVGAIEVETLDEVAMQCVETQGRDCEDEDATAEENERRHE